MYETIAWCYKTKHSKNKKEVLEIRKVWQKYRSFLDELECQVEDVHRKEKKPLPEKRKTNKKIREHVQKVNPGQKKFQKESKKNDKTIIKDLMSKISQNSRTCIAIHISK